MSTTENKATPAATPEQAAESQQIPIEVSVRPIKPRDKLYAYADVTLGGIKFFGFQIKANKSGELYTDMPGGYDKAGNWQTAGKPVSPEAYQQLNNAVVGQYMQEIENMRATLEATSAQRQAPAPVQEQAGTGKETSAPTATRPAAKEQAKAPDKKTSLSGQLKEKAAQAKAQPPKQAAGRGGNELGA